MTLEDLKKIKLLQTRSVAEAMTKDEKTFAYVADCVNRFWAGDYGEVPTEDTDANNNDLSCGYGHVLAHYKQAYELTNDIYIEAHFDKDNLNDIDYTQTLVMYVDER